MELNELQAQFDKSNAETLKAVADLKLAVSQEIAEKTKNGFADPETKEKLDRLFKHVDELDAKLSAPGRTAAPTVTKSAGELLTEDERFTAWQKGGFTGSKNLRFGFPGFSAKTISDSGLGSGTSGVLMPSRIPGLVELQKQRLTIRDLLRTRPLTVGNSVDWLKQNVATLVASPQVEASAKAESTITYTTASSTVRTIAHFIQVTRQALDDAPWLRADIDTELMYGLKLKEEQEILSGIGTGEHLSGLVTQATAYDTGTYNVAGDTKLDKIRHMILQARVALYPVDGIVLNPVDVEKIDLIKVDQSAANTGLYIIGDPKGGSEFKTLWGRPVIESDSITSGQCLVGSFGLGAMLFDRMQAMIDISFEHSTNFTTNQATILAEERLALACLRPASFIYGAI